MAGTREASIKVTLNTGAFRTGLKQMTAMTKSAGRAMGSALKTPMTAGLASARQSMTNMVGGMKRGMSQMATLGGAVSVGLLVKDAVKLNSQFRNIAFNISKVEGNAVSWMDVQKLVDQAALDTGQSAEDMATAFDTVFKATGSLEFARESLKGIGTVATASGKDTLALARAAELLNRKFGLTGEQAAAGLTRIIEKTGVGGIELEDMTRRFGVMATEAVAAGATGEEGISQLLGTMIKLDAQVGENAAPAMKIFFQKLKDGTVDLERLKKASGLKFEEGEDFSSKLRKILGSEKALAEAKKTFTAESRVVFDVLAKPFQDTFDDVLKSGGKKQDAVRAGLDAFDASMKEGSESTLKFSDLQQKAAERMKDDPSVLLKQAITKVKIAFAQPEMIDAITELAKNLPAFAAGLTEVVNFIVKQPLRAALIALAARIALAAAGGAAQAAGGALLKGAGARIAATSALAAAGAGGAGSGLTGAVVGSGLAGGAGAAAATAATIAAGAVAAGGVGVGVGLLIGKAVGQEENQAGDFAAQTDARFVQGVAERAGRSGTDEQKRDALALIAEQRKAIADNASVWNTAAESVLSILPTSLNPAAGSATRAEIDLRLEGQAAKLQSQLDRRATAEGMLATAAERTSKALERTARAASNSTRGVNPPPAANPGAGTTAPGA